MTTKLSIKITEVSHLKRDVNRYLDTHRLLMSKLIDF